MNPLVAIMSHSTASPTVERHWPFYLKSGCSILGVGREDTECLWPFNTKQFIGQLRIGKESYANGDNHIVRFLTLLDAFLETPEWKPFTHLIVVEYDGLFFAPPPKFKTDTFYAKLAGGGSEGFLGSMYLHTPWCMDRLCAGRILKYGRAMHGRGLIERGFLDRWFGLMIDLYDLQWRDTGDGTWTHNTIDTPDKVADCRRAIKAGAWYVHGVKTADQLKAITEGIV